MQMMRTLRPLQTLLTLPMKTNLQKEALRNRYQIRPYKKTHLTVICLIIQIMQSVFQFVVQPENGDKQIGSGLMSLMCVS